MKRKLSQKCSLPQLSADNSELMNNVFTQTGVDFKNLGQQKRNFAVASFNRAFAQGRDNAVANLDWFKSLMGLNRN